MAREVVITGMGVISALGDSPEDLYTALLRGHDSSDASKSKQPVATPWGLAAASFDPTKYLGNHNLRPLDRASQLLACAAQLALQDSAWTVQRRQEEEVGLVVGTMFSTAKTIAEFDQRALRSGPCYASPMDFANTVLNAPAGQTAICHGLRGANSTVATGASSGLQALAHAADLIAAGRLRAALAGGVEELSFETYCGFQRAGRLCMTGRPLPFDLRRSGFLLGEGAALVMLEDADMAAARKAPILARLAGHGSRFDTSRGKQEERSVAGISQSIRVALASSGLGVGDIQCIIASARGEVTGDRYEGRALREVFQGRGNDLAVTTISSQTGEALGASGVFQVIALLQILCHGAVPGIPDLEQVEGPFLLGKVNRLARTRWVRNGLVNSVGLDGHSCAVVVTAN